MQATAGFDLSSPTPDKQTDKGGLGRFSQTFGYCYYFVIIIFTIIINNINNLLILLLIELFLRVTLFLTINIFLIILLALFFRAFYKRTAKVTLLKSVT